MWHLWRLVDVFGWYLSDQWFVDPFNEVCCMPPPYGFSGYCLNGNWELPAFLIAYDWFSLKTLLISLFLFASLYQSQFYCHCLPPCLKRQFITQDKVLQHRLFIYIFVWHKQKQLFRRNLHLWWYNTSPSAMKKQSIFLERHKHIKNKKYLQYWKTTLQKFC